MYNVPGIEWRSENDYTITDKQKAIEWCIMVTNRIGLAKLYTRQAARQRKNKKRGLGDVIYMARTTAALLVYMEYPTIDILYIVSS